MVYLGLKGYHTVKTTKLKFLKTKMFFQSSWPKEPYIKLKKIKNFKEKQQRYTKNNRCSTKAV